MSLERIQSEGVHRLGRTNQYNDLNRSSMETGMLMSRRRNEPAHYMLKIESFSLLFEAGTIEIESDVFEASGHKWRLVLYPNGNDEEGGSIHISLYVMICETERYSKGWEVSVDVNFYLYDHTDHYFVFLQDVQGNRTRFNEKKMKWGLAKLISFESFKESKNGYLVNDACVFGAELFAVSQYTQKDRCLSMTKPLATLNTHTWTIANFSDVTEKELRSEMFKVGKVKWKLSVYPKGCLEAQGTHLSIFLCVHDAALLPGGWKVYAKYKLRVKNHSGKLDNEIGFDHWFYNLASSWGRRKFMLLSELGDLEKGFMLNGSIIVEVEISILGVLKNFI